MLRILQIIDSMKVGGAERMCLNISYALDKNKIDNAIICTREKGPLGEKASVPIFVLNKKNSIDILAFVRLIKRVKSFRPTHLHLHSTSLYWGVFAKMFFPKVKLIWHDHYGNRINAGFTNHIIQIFLILTNHLLVVNDELLRFWSSNRAYSSINAINNFPFFYTQMLRENESKGNLIQVANFRNPKNHQCTLKALSLLEKKGIRLNCVLVGNKADEEYFNDIQGIINIDGLKNVRLDTNNSNPEDLLLTSDVGILSSSYEGLPVALLEYGLAGLIVICTDVGECAEVLGNGKFGYLVPPNDYEAFAEKLEYIMLDWDEAKVKAKLFQEHVKLNYGSEAFITNYLQIIVK